MTTTQQIQAALTELSSLEMQRRCIIRDFTPEFGLKDATAFFNAGLLPKSQEINKGLAELRAILA